LLSSGDVNGACLEGPRCATPSHRFMNRSPRSKHACDMHSMATQSPASSCCTCWRVGKRLRATTRRACWGSIAIPAGAGWRGMPPGVRTPCWPLTSPQANRSRSHRQCSPAWRRLSASPKALRRMRRCADGCTKPRGGRSRTRRATPSCACAAAPSSRGRAPATQKTPAAMPAFQASGHAHRQQALPPANTRPVRVFSQDERRVG
jgi:hypothetical protein